MEIHLSPTARLNYPVARRGRWWQKSTPRWRLFFRCLFWLIGYIEFSACLHAAAPSAPETVQWDYDSLNSSESHPSVAGDEIAAALNRMTDQWNAHNLEGYLTIFWNSPKLSVITDGSVTSGYRELYNSYQRSYSDLEIMGKVEISRVRIRLVRANLALALSKWTFLFPKTNHAVAGIDTTYLQKFDSEWKIVSSHTTTVDL